MVNGTGFGGGPYNDTLRIKQNVNDTEIDSFTSVMARTINNEDGDALIDLGSGNSITLHGIRKDQLISRNFIIF